VQYLSGWFMRQDGPAYRTAYVDTDASFRRPNVLSARADDRELCRTVAVSDQEGGVPGTSTAPRCTASSLTPFFVATTRWRTSLDGLEGDAWMLCVDDMLRAGRCGSWCGVGTAWAPYAVTAAAHRAASGAPPPPPLDEGSGDDAPVEAELATLHEALRAVYKRASPVTHAVLDAHGLVLDVRGRTHNNVQYMLPEFLLLDYFSAADVDELLHTYSLRPLEEQPP